MKILVIDDEKTIRKALIFALQKKGHEVHDSDTSAGAYREIINTCFDLIVIDWNIPFFSCAGFIENLRKRGTQVPVIVLSSMHLKKTEFQNQWMDRVYPVTKDKSLDEIINFIEGFFEAAKSGNN